MHVARQRIISNRSLLQRAREADVPQYIQSKPFIPKLWIPYNFKFAKRVRESVPPDPSDRDLNLGDSHMEELRVGSQKHEMDDALEEGEFIPSEAQGQGEPHEEQSEPAPQDAPEVEAHQIVSETAPQRPRKRSEDTRVQWLGDKVRTPCYWKSDILNECDVLVRSRCCRSTHRSSRHHGRHRVGSQNLEGSRVLPPPC